MSYICAGCHQFKEGRGESKATEIEMPYRIVQEEYRPGLLRVYTVDIKERARVKKEQFCPTCSLKVGAPTIKLVEE
jgi:hypothetical protein